jgi:hypothetical protein
MTTPPPPGTPDPYAVLGVTPHASHAEIAAAYRHTVRACHPDAPHPDPDRLAAVVAAYQALRRRRATDDQPLPAPQRGTVIPVRVHHRIQPVSPPDLRAGPVRHHHRSAAV